MNSNPYAPPKAVVADIETLQESPPLWNPNAAANWSLLFSPAFGAFLHMKNWEALGEPEKASVAKVWVTIVVVILIAIPLVVVLVPGLRGMRGFSNYWGILLLLAWYLTSGRAQAQYVKERFGKNYPRRGWGKPLFIAVTAVVGYFVALAILGTLLVGLTGQL